MPQDTFNEEPIAQADELESMGEDAGRYARKLLDESQHAGEAADRLLGAIRDEPVKSAFIALGVGAVIGMLLRRR